MKPSLATEDMIIKTQSELISILEDGNETKPTDFSKIDLNLEKYELPD